MVGWRDDTGLLGPYKGWKVIIGSEQNVIKTNIATSYKQLFEWLRDYMAVDTVTLLLPLANQLHLTVLASLGLEAEVEQQIYIPSGEGIAGRIAVNRQPMIVDNLAEVEVCSSALHQTGLQSFVDVPLILKQGVVGVLHVRTFPFRQFTQRDVQQLQLAAYHLSSTLTPIFLG